MRRHATGTAVLVALICGLDHPVHGQQATTITVTDRVLVKDCQRFGINLGGDAYYSGAVLVKKRVRENFERTTYRQCHFGPLQDEHGAATWFNPPDEWRKILIGGSYTILSGPAKGTSGTIADITTSNEFEQTQPQVEVVAGRITDFPPAQGIELPPHSLTALAWETPR